MELDPESVFTKGKTYIASRNLHDVIDGACWNQAVIGGDELLFDSYEYDVRCGWHVFNFFMPRFQDWFAYRIPEQNQTYIEILKATFIDAAKGGGVSQ